MQSEQEACNHTSRLGWLVYQFSVVGCWPCLDAPITAGQRKAMTYKNNRSEELRAQAAEARAIAAAATLPKVRDRAIHSAEAWEMMAELAERTDLGLDKWAQGASRA